MMRTVREIVYLFIAVVIAYQIGYRNASVAWRAWCNTGTCYSSQGPPQ